MEWVDTMMMVGLEAEALGHKGHALYRQRVLLVKAKEEAIRLLTASICLSSGVLSAVCIALSDVRRGGGDAGKGDGGQKQNQCAGSQGRERGKGGGHEGEGAVKEGEQEGGWVEKAEVVRRDVSATRVIALGTLGDVYLALGSVFQARAAYKVCEERPRHGAYTSMHMSVHVYVHTYMHTHIHTYVHVYIHIYRYTMARAHSLVHI